MSSRPSRPRTNSTLTTAARCRAKQTIADLEKRLNVMSHRAEIDGTATWIAPRPMSILTETWSRKSKRSSVSPPSRLSRRGIRAFDRSSNNRGKCDVVASDNRVQFGFTGH